MKLSASKIGTFNTCKKRYYYTYIEKLAPKKKEPAPSIGDVAHAGFLHLRKPQHHYQDQDPKYVTELVLNKMNEYFEEEYKDQTLELKNEVWDESQRIMIWYIKNYLIEEYKTIAVELWEEIPFHEHMLIVRADALIKVRNLFLTRQYKTASSNPTKKLSFYSQGFAEKGYVWGLNKVLKEPVAGSLFSFLIKTKIPQFEEHPVIYGHHDLDLYEQSLAEVIRDIEYHERENFYPRDLNECNPFIFSECPFKPICLIQDTPDVRQALYQPRKEKITWRG